MFDKEYQSTPVNCKADRLSVFCASRAKMSAIRTRHDKTTFLVTKGDNGHFRTLRAITYKKILNKSNAILAACLHLLATFGLECRAFAYKKKYHLQKSGGGGKRPPLPLPVRRLCIANIKQQYYLNMHDVPRPMKAVLPLIVPDFSRTVFTYLSSCAKACNHLNCITVNPFLLYSHLCLQFQLDL